MKCKCTKCGYVIECKESCSDHKESCPACGATNCWEEVSSSSNWEGASCSTKSEKSGCCKTETKSSGCCKENGSMDSGSCGCKPKSLDHNQLTFTLKAIDTEITFADQHYLGAAAKGVSEEILEQIKSCYAAETNEAGMYLTMARQAYREGFPEIARLYKDIALEELEHASRFLEMYKGPVHYSTMKNLLAVIQGEAGASKIRLEIAGWAKKNGFDALHDSVHEICKDEARHGRAFYGIYKRYFE